MPAAYDQPRVIFVPFACPSCQATKPVTSGVRTIGGQRIRCHQCKRCGLRYQSVEAAASIGSAAGARQMRMPAEPAARTVPVKLETLDEVITDAILVLVEVREGATSYRERAMLDERIVKLRARLRAEYRRRGLSP